MLKRGVTLTICAALVVAAACGDDNDSTSPPVSKIVNFKATMTPAGEPGTLNGSPTGSGTFTATLDTSTNVFTWSAQFSGLTSNVTNGHIHGPFVPGTSGSAGVILNFDPASATSTAFSNVTFTGLKTATSGLASGSVVLNSSVSFANNTISGDSLRKLLLAGATYVNIHTSTNGGGEIRGQITKQ